MEIEASIALAGERRRIFVCASHLKGLGQGFHQFAQDHGGDLPAALVENGTNTTSWDSQIAPYLAGQRSAAKPADLEARVGYLFQCPSDKEPRGDSRPRTYSMPIYDVAKAGWPAEENSVGGLGLCLNAKALKQLQEGTFAPPPGSLPVLRQSVMSAPADTALLVERVSILNALWSTRFACTTPTDKQFDAKTFPQQEFHYGKMNYLLFDGHVELLFPVQSTGFGGGLWTLRAGD